MAMPDSELEMNSMATAPSPRPAIPRSEFKPRTVVEIAAMPRMITPVVGQKLASRASKPKLNTEDAMRSPMMATPRTPMSCLALGLGVAWSLMVAP